MMKPGGRHPKVKPFGVTFNRRLYSPASVSRAVESFREVAVFTVKVGQHLIRVSGTVSQPELASLLEDEFCNAVLANEKARLAGGS